MIFIGNQEVEVVKSFKYVGSSDERFSLCDEADYVYNRAQQRLFQHIKLNGFYFRRLNVKLAKKNLITKSFIPSAILILNATF